MIMGNFDDNPHQQFNPTPPHIQLPIPQSPTSSLPPDPFEQGTQSISVDAPPNLELDTRLVNIFRFINNIRNST